MKKFTMFLLLLVAFTASYAAFTKVGMAGLPFLKIGVGRSTGMGEAFVAIADDASAAYWNPAGIALLNRNQVIINHIDWIADITHEFVAGAIITKAGNIGISITALSLGQFEETTIDEYQGTGRKFSGNDLAVGLSFARMFTDKLAFGLTAKVLSEKIWDVGTNSVAFDFGVHYNTGWRNLRLGMAIANFGPDLRYSGSQLNFSYNPDWEWPWTREPLPATLLTETFPLPVLFRFGIAYDVFKFENSILTAAVDLNHFNDVNEKLNIGMEYQIGGFFLRGGYILNTDVDYSADLGWQTGISLGTGLRVKPFNAVNLEVDYAYRNLGRLGLSHRLTLGLEF